LFFILKGDLPDENATFELGEVVSPDEDQLFGILMHRDATAAHALAHSYFQCLNMGQRSDFKELLHLTGAQWLPSKHDLRMPWDNYLERLWRQTATVSMLDYKAAQKIFQFLSQHLGHDLTLHQFLMAHGILAQVVPYLLLDTKKLSMCGKAIGMGVGMAVRALTSTWVVPEPDSQLYQEVLRFLWRRGINFSPVNFHHIWLLATDPQQQTHCTLTAVLFGLVAQFMVTWMLRGRDVAQQVFKLVQGDALSPWAKQFFHETLGQHTCEQFDRALKVVEDTCDVSSVRTFLKSWSASASPSTCASPSTSASLSTSASSSLGTSASTSTIDTEITDAFSHALKARFRRKDKRTPFRPVWEP
jgi:hypothetical protein